MFRVGATGVTDSVALEVPDPHYLAFDGSSFWTVGSQQWRRILYRFDQEGHIVAVYDLPASQLLGSFVSGLAIEGMHVWCGETALCDSTPTILWRLAPD